MIRNARARGHDRARHRSGVRKALSERASATVALRRTEDRPRGCLRRGAGRLYAAARWRTVRESRKPSRLSDPDRPQPLGRSDAQPDAGSCRILRSEEHTSELQSLMRISYAVFCLKKKKITK